MSRFTGKVAIVTGAASGIGKEIALRFAAVGGVHVIADLNFDAADATALEISAKGSDAFAIAMNVADEAAVEKGVADTMAKYGRIDVLVSNAGIQIVKPVVDFPFVDWKRLLAIHLDGAFLTTKACLRHIYKARSGSIVYMGSVHSKEAWPPRAIPERRRSFSAPCNRRPSPSQQTEGNVPALMWIGSGGGLTSINTGFGLLV